MSLLSVILVTILILSLTTNPISSISLPGTSLSGDAHFAAVESSVILNRQTPSSSGILFQTTPFSFNSTTSFSSNFTFQIGNNIALVIIPYKLAKTASFNAVDVEKLLIIEFDVSSRVRVCNISIISNELKEGVKLVTWIDYHAVLRRLDVKLSQFGEPKKALVSFRVNLGEMLKGEEVVFGLVSTNENNDNNNNNNKVSSVYSWWIEVKDVPKWMHSVAADPRYHANVVKSDDKKKKRCVLSGVMFITGCGALAALALLFVSLFVGDRENVKREVDEFKYEKIGAVVAKDVESGVKK